MSAASGTAGLSGRVQAHLAVLLASPQFAGSERQSRLLRYIVDTALAGDTDALKESVIAAQLYARGGDYDPQVHSSVRVDMGRLRQRLSDYYSAAGATDLRISVPKGTYVPRFDVTSAAPASGRGMLRRYWVAAAGTAAALVLRRPSRSGLVVFTGTPEIFDSLRGHAFTVRSGPPAGERPFAQLVVAQGAEDDRRYASALLYTDLYEFPAAAESFEFADPEQLRASMPRIAQSLSAMQARTEHITAQLRSEPRRRAAAICREVWRQRSGGPEFSAVADDPPLPLPELLRRVAALERAVEIDPKFACAHAELAWAYRLAAEHDPALYTKARGHAEQAAGLDPNLGLAQFVLGYVQFFSEWRFREASERLLRAVQAHPLRVEWYRYFADSAKLTGRHEAAEREIDRARAYDPAAQSLLLARAQIDQYRRDWARMEARSRKLAEMSPRSPSSVFLLARALLYQGRVRESEAVLHGSNLTGHVSYAAGLARARAYAGDRAGAERHLSHPAWPKAPSVELLIRALIGQRDRAQELLRAAMARRDPNLPFALCEPEPRLDSERWLAEAAASTGVVRA
jgi:Tfp pilus assembly protein PilF